MKKASKCLHKIEDARVKQLSTTPVRDMRQRLKAMHRALSCLAGLNKKLDGHHDHLNAAINEAYRRELISQVEASELKEIAQNENWAKHRSVGHDPAKEPPPWFFFKEEEGKMELFQRNLEWKMAPNDRFEYSYKQWTYTVQISADGHSGYQANHQTGKVRQLVRGRKDMVAD